MNLYLNESEIPYLKSLTTSQSHAQLWANIKAWCDGRLSLAPLAEPNADTARYVYDEMRAHIESMTLAYYLLSYPSTSSAYLNSALDWLLSLINWSSWSHIGVFDHRYQTIADHMAAFGFDALGDYMTTSEHDAFLSKFITEATVLWDAIKNLAPPNLNSANTMGRQAGAIGLAGLSLLDYFADAQTWVDKATQLGRWNLRTIGITGENREGRSYMDSQLTMMIPFMNSLKRIQGTDLFAEFPVLATVPDYYLYWDHNGYWLQLEDAWYGEKAITKYKNDEGFLYLLASIYNNGYAQHYADCYAAVIPGNARMSCFLWKDPAIVPLLPDDRELTKRFRSYDYAIFKSGWQQNDLLFVLKCGTSIGHAHQSQNEFQIYNLGIPIATGGGYAYQDTEYHNTIIVNDMNQVNEGEDNGQMDYHGLGVIEEVISHTPYYRYARGNATACYQPPVNKAVRHVVYVEPDYFVIFDDLSASTAALFEYMLHAQNYINNWQKVALSISGDYVSISGGFGGTVKVQIVRPYPYSITGPTQYSGVDGHASYYVRVRPPANATAAQFLTVAYTGTTWSAIDISVGNVIGIRVPRANGDLDVILFSKDGSYISNQYIELDGIYEANDGQVYNFSGTGVNVSFATYMVMRLSPIDQTVGKLYTQTVPQGALLEITGPGGYSFTGIAPRLLEDLAPGDYIITASLVGYDPQTVIQAVEAGKTAEVTIDLSMTAQAIIDVNSTPAGAELTVDGIFVGNTPKAVPVAPDTYHDIAIALAGYATWVTEVTVGAGQTYNINAVLTPIPTPAGNLFVDSIPQEASVIIAGVLMGVTPITIPNIEPGEYVGTISLTGYVSQQFRATVVADQTTNVMAILKSGSAGPGSGPELLSAVAFMLALMKLKNR